MATLRTGTLHPALTLIFLLTLGCEPESPPSEAPGGSQASTEETNGRLVIVGGALQSENLPVYQAVLDGREGPGPLCVLPTASGNPEESMEGYVSTFDEIGGPGTARGVFLTVDNASEADSEDVAAELAACGGFFFTGGSQSRISRVFRPEGESTRAFDAVWNRFRAGAVVAGSSAGAAIMTDPMIAGGGSEESLRVGLRSSEDGEGVLLERGLGFLDAGLIDQHFLARGRWGRLLVALLNTEGDGLGFGIDENTALVVDGNRARVVGASSVIFMDARDASEEAQGTGGYGVRLFLLGGGDELDLTDGRVFPAANKGGLSPSEAPFPGGQEDLFDRYALLEVLHDLALAQDPRLTFEQEGYLVEFRKGAEFRALAGDGASIFGTPEGLFLGPFILSVWRE